MHTLRKLTLTATSIPLARLNKERIMEEKKYLTPEVEKVEIPEEDIVSTSPTIELPWLPIEDEI